jgi:hypothetical protein
MYCISQFHVIDWISDGRKLSLLSTRQLKYLMMFQPWN